MRIGVIGGGVVGQATAQSYRGHVEEVRIFDLLPERSTHHTMREVLDTDMVFICVPTPQKQDSLECDLACVHAVCMAVTIHDHHEANLVLRSTVPVGTTRMLREKYGLTNLIHSPEFLTARTAVEDAANPTRLLIGGKFPGREFWLTPQCTIRLKQLYERCWPRIAPWLMTSDESEAVKLMQNAFSAVKISMFNEFHAFCSRQEHMDWDRVLDALLAGGWVSPHHTQVPGPDGKYGFGGSCLPKDLASLIFQMEQLKDYDSYPFLCNAAHERNKLDRERTE